MEDNKNLTSLLDDNTTQEEQTSLLDGTVETVESTEALDTQEDFVIGDEINNAYELEKKKKYFMDPKNQAQILLTNYVNSQEVLVNHAQRRKLYAEFYKNAKKGKYRKIFRRGNGFGVYPPLRAGKHSVARFVFYGDRLP